MNLPIFTEVLHYFLKNTALVSKAPGWMEYEIKPDYRLYVVKICHLLIKGIKCRHDRSKEFGLVSLRTKELH